MKLSTKLSKLVKSINEEGEGGGVGGGAAQSTGGSGTVADLGSPPMYGFPNKRRPVKKKKSTVDLRQVSEAVDDFNDEQIKTEVDVQDDTEEIADNPEANPMDNSMDNPTGDPEEYTDQEVDNAISVLDDTTEEEETNGSEDPNGSEETKGKEERPKVRMSRVLKHKVFKTIRNRHARENLPKYADTTYSSENPLSLTNRLNVVRESFFRKIMEADNDPVDNEIIMGEVIKKDNRYVFAARISVDNAHRDFIFEGNYEQVEALLTILKAKMEDLPGKSDDIMKEVNSRISPVRVFVELDSLLTDGIRYAKQILTK